MKQQRQQGDIAKLEIVGGVMKKNEMDLSLRWEVVSVYVFARISNKAMTKIVPGALPTSGDAFLGMSRCFGRGVFTVHLCLRSVGRKHIDIDITREDGTCGE
jgi:hypothetical protein